ncbi:prohormone-3-like [Tachypleus tridentatus]|uniref:prohormone-3-like n=1 Tax=Tachypleus tridentatus TaxID=6853 RepID=UPI003FD2AB8A
MENRLLFLLFLLGFPGWTRAIRALGADVSWSAKPFSTPRRNPDFSKVGELKKVSGTEHGSLLSNDNQCFGKRCFHSNQCCLGSVCVDTDGTGTCLPLYGQEEGQFCHQDSNCQKNLTCTQLVSDPRRRTCQFPKLYLRKKQYNDECLDSSECDASKDLCCQLLRRHRMAPRKVCFYFIDPMSCIGNVKPAYKSMPILSFFPNPFFKARLG